MPSEIEVSEVRISLRNGNSGALVGWASCVINGGLRVNSIEIKRGAKDKLFLACPTQESRSGVPHPYFSPINREARAALEEAILSRLPAVPAENGEQA